VRMMLRALRAPVMTSHMCRRATGSMPVLGSSAAQQRDRRPAGARDTREGIHRPRCNTDVPRNTTPAAPISATASESCSKTATNARVKREWTASRRPAARHQGQGNEDSYSTAGRDVPPRSHRASSIRCTRRTLRLFPPE
jgi:hypothetical protein